MTKNVKLIFDHFEKHCTTAWCTFSLMKLRPIALILTWYTLSGTTWHSSHSRVELRHTNLVNCTILSALQRAVKRERASVKSPTQTESALGTVSVIERGWASEVFLDATELTEPNERVVALNACFFSKSLALIDCKGLTVARAAISAIGFSM